MKKLVGFIELLLLAITLYFALIWAKFIERPGFLFSVDKQPIEIEPIICVVGAILGILLYFREKILGAVREGVNKVRHHSTILSSPKMPVSQYFIGRERDLDNIHKYLHKNTGPILMLRGVGGIGKTSLAYHYFQNYQIGKNDSIIRKIMCLLKFHKLNNSFDNLIWMDFSEGVKGAIKDSDLHDILEIKLDEIDMHPHPILLLNAIRFKIKDLKGFNLIILDNVLDTNILLFVRDKWPLHNWSKLITSRLTNIDMPEYHLRPLKKKEAIRLFTYYCPKSRRELPYLEKIIERIDSNTCVIVLLSKSLNEIDEKISPVKWLYEKINEGGILGLNTNETSVVSLPGYTEGKKEPDEIVRKMFSMINMEESRRKILIEWSLFPNVTIPEKIKNFLFIDSNNDGREKQIREDLMWLVNNGWVEKSCNAVNENCLWRLHHLIADVALDLAKDNLTIIDRITSRIQALINESEIPVVVSIAYQAEHRVKSHFSQTERHDYVNKIKKQGFASQEAVSDFYNLQNYIKDLSSQRVENNDPVSDYLNRLRTSFNKKGKEQVERKNYEEALKFYFEQFEYLNKFIENEIENEEIFADLSACSAEIALVYNYKNDTVQSIHWQEKALSILSKNLGNNLSAANALQVAKYTRLLGWYHGRRNNLDGAQEKIKFIQQAIQVLDDTASKVSDIKELLRQAAIYYDQIGETYFYINNYNSAIKSYQQSIFRFKNIEDSELNQNSIAVVEGHLGDVYQTLRDLGSARMHYQNGIDIYDLILKTPGKSADYWMRCADYHSQISSIILMSLPKNIIQDGILHHLQKSVSLSEEIANSFSNNANYLFSLGMAYELCGRYNSFMFSQVLNNNQNYSNFLNEYKDTNLNDFFNKAITFYNKSLKAYSRVNTIENESARAIEALQLVNEYLGNHYIENKNYKEAQKHLLSAKIFAEIVHNRYPGSMVFHKQLSIVNSRLADICFLSDEKKEAFEYSMKAIQLSKELVEKFPNVAQIQNVHGVNLEQRGTFFFNIDEKSEAKNLLEQAKVYHQKSVELTDGKHVFYLNHLENTDILILRVS